MQEQGSWARRKIVLQHSLIFNYLRLLLMYPKRFRQQLQNLCLELHVLVLAMWCYAYINKVFIASIGDLIRPAENALKLERRRLQKYKELVERYQSMNLTSEKELRSKEREIVRQIKQIIGSVGAVRSSPFMKNQLQTSTALPLHVDP
uniref:Uncharacterized protein n=1 Tax=Opuntia streptacantha TaxID=393608 RepID=A0A7C9AGN5_OPUST